MTIFDANRTPQRPEVFDRFGRNLSGSTLRWLVFGVGGLILLYILSTFLVRATRIEAGYTGIEVNLAGSQRGASEIPIRTGWVCRRIFRLWAPCPIWRIGCRLIW